jgi:hypothetical protein
VRLGTAAIVVLATASSLALLACTTRRELPRGDAGPRTDAGPARDAATDAPRPIDATPPRDAPPPPCLTGTTPVEVALDARIEEACAIWNSLDLLSGMATVTRTGDTLTIDFGDGVIFTGTVTGTSVMLSYVHAHEFTDGCGWQAVETLAGTIDSDCSLSLTYDYVEAVAIDRGLCATPCSAEADVTLDVMPLI